MKACILSLCSRDLVAQASQSCHNRRGACVQPELCGVLGRAPRHPPVTLTMPLRRVLCCLSSQEAARGRVSDLFPKSRAQERSGKEAPRTAKWIVKSDSLSDRKSLIRSKHAPDSLSVPRTAG